MPSRALRSGVYKAAIPAPLCLFGLVLFVEIAVLAASYSLILTCVDTSVPWLCDELAIAKQRVVWMAGAAVVAGLARWPRSAALLAVLECSPRPGWLVVHAFGVVALATPWLFLRTSTSPEAFYWASGLWAVGSLLGIVGAVFAVAPPRRLGEVIRRIDPAWPAVMLVAAFAPELPRSVLSALWGFTPIVDFTFWATAGLLRLVASGVVADPVHYLLGTGGFVVEIGWACSGVEGFALITIFLGLYLVWFREHLRFPRALLLWPIGIAASWILNVLRIDALVLLGANVSPDLAVDSFHSHAGWLMFTILSLSLAIVAHRVSWLRADLAPAGVAALHWQSGSLDGSADPFPLTRDPVAAAILPFVVFMASALVLQTFTRTPDLYYPLKAAASLAALLAFHRVYRALPWRLDPVAIAAGVAVGAVWLFTAPTLPVGESPLATQLAALPAAGLAMWAVVRILGTTALVPVIEELFFRGYVLTRIDSGGAMRVVAILVSSALFGALHERWLAGGLSGVVFALVMLRRRRVTDAVLAHAVANGIIAAAAAASGDWALI